MLLFTKSLISLLQWLISVNVPIFFLDGSTPETSNLIEKKKIERVYDCYLFVGIDLQCYNRYLQEVFTIIVVMFHRGHFMEILKTKNLADCVPNGAPVNFLLLIFDHNLFPGISNQLQQMSDGYCLPVPEVTSLPTLTSCDM